MRAAPPNVERVSLSQAQKRMLHDLYPDADNAEAMWYFGQARQIRTLDSLERKGLVRVKRYWIGGGDCYGARLTPAGYAWLGV